MEIYKNTETVCVDGWLFFTRLPGSDAALLLLVLPLQPERERPPQQTLRLGLLQPGAAGGRAPPRGGEAGRAGGVAARLGHRPHPLANTLVLTQFNIIIIKIIYSFRNIQ